MCDDSNAMAAFVGDQDRTNVTLAEVAPIAIDAVLAAEDRDFYDHSGIDAGQRPSVGTGVAQTFRR